VLYLAWDRDSGQYDQVRVNRTAISLIESSVQTSDNITTTNRIDKSPSPHRLIVPVGTSLV